MAFACHRHHDDMLELASTGFGMPANGWILVSALRLPDSGGVGFQAQMLPRAHVDQGKMPQALQEYRTRMLRANPTLPTAVHIALCSGHGSVDECIQEKCMSFISITTPLPDNVGSDDEKRQVDAMWKTAIYPAIARELIASQFLSGQNEELE